jgi:hypothetical protein
MTFYCRELTLQLIINVYSGFVISLEPLAILVCWHVLQNMQVCPPNLQLLYDCDLHSGDLHTYVSSVPSLITATKSRHIDCGSSLMGHSVVNRKVTHDFICC